MPFPRKRGRSPGEILLLFLIEHGGSATKSEIRRRTASGRLIAEAAPEMDGLITTEVSRGSATKRPVARVSLTLAGLAAAQALRPDWQPRRLATPILKEWLAELQGERERWAMQILRDAEDANKWRSHEAKVRRKELVCEPPKPKARPRGRPFVAQGVNGPSTRDLPASPRAATPATAEHSAGSKWGGGFSVPIDLKTPANRPPVRKLPAPITAMQAVEQRREQEAGARLEARKAELKRHCVICNGDSCDLPHECSRFQVA